MKNAVICRLPSPRCKTKCGWKWQGMGLQGKERKMFGKGIPTVERRRDGKIRIIKFISTSQQWASTTPKPKKDVINPSDRTSISRFSMLKWSAFAERILTTVHDFAVKLAIFSVDWTSDFRNQRGNPSHTHPSTAPGCARRLRLQWSGPQSQLRIDASAQIHSTVLLQRFKFLASKNARCRFNSRLCCQYQQSIPELPNRHRVRAAST